MVPEVICAFLVRGLKENCEKFCKELYAEKESIEKDGEHYKMICSTDFPCDMLLLFSFEDLAYECSVDITYLFSEFDDQLSEYDEDYNLEGFLSTNGLAEHGSVHGFDKETDAVDDLKILKCFVSTFINDEPEEESDARDDFFANFRANRLSLHRTWDVVKCRPFLQSDESAPSNAGGLRDGTVRVMTDEKTIQALITAKFAQNNIRRVKMVIDFIDLPMKVLVLPSAPPNGIRFEVFYREGSMAIKADAAISWNPSNGALFSDATATGDISDRVKEFVCASYYYILNCLASDENLWDYVTPERKRDLEHLLILADENGITGEVAYGKDRPDVLSINASGVDCYVRPCPNEAALLQKSGGTKAKASGKNKNTPNRHVEQNKPEKTLTQRMLSESLLLALDDYDISGVKVMCEETVCDEVSQFFFSNFAAGWMAAVQMAEEEYGECESVDIPVKIVKKDYGFLISVGHLEVRYCYGDFYDEEHSFKAFEKALKKMKEAYPESEYEGYIDYFLSDRRGGEALRWELASTRSPEAYDFVGEGLGQILADEKFENSVFWSILSEALECNRKECEETIKALYTYAKWIRKADLDRIVKAILNLAEEDGENNAGPLAELVERLEAGEAEGGSNEDALLQREKGLKPQGKGVVMDNYITIYVTSQMLVDALADSAKKNARKNIQIELQKDEVEIHVSKCSGKAERPPENMADFISKLTNLISFETVRLSDDILLDIKEVSWSSALWFFDVAVERAEFEYDKKDRKSRFTYTKGDDRHEHNTDESAYAQEPTRKKRPLKEGAKPLPLKASDENPYFELQDNGATYTITAYIGAEKHVNIPDFIDGKPVCKIGDAAFSSNANKTRKKQLNAIETVIIPNTVKKLGRDVFAGCEKLEKVVFSDAIISIPEAGEHDGFFFGCEALKEVVLPKHLERIERKAFNWCSGLETVILPSTLKVIGSQAFAHCQKLSNLLLPGSLEYIADRAFIACDSFTEINFPSQIKTVHEYACSGQNLKKVVLPEGIEVVESSAFGLAKKLEEIVAPDKFVRWGCMAIDEDSPLYNRYGYNKEDPATALRYMNRNLIGYVGKYSGKVYADVYIQEGTVRLVSYAFSYVNNIEKVHIPQSVIDIEDKAFHCSPDVAICAVPGGIAEKYAKQHNMKFEAE